jgi:hypothetical protein
MWDWIVGILLSATAFKLYALIIVGLLTYAGKQLVSYLRLKMGGDKFEQFATQVEQFVRYLEQIGIIQKLSNEEKKQRATVFAHQLRDALKLDISDEMIDIVIEAFVQVLNTEAGKFTKPLPAQELNVGYTPHVSGPFINPPSQE